MRRCSRPTRSCRASTRSSRPRRRRSSRATRSSRPSTTSSIIAILELSRTQQRPHQPARAVCRWPIVILGPDLRIRRFTPLAEKMLNLIPADLGRPIRDVKLGLPIARSGHLAHRRDRDAQRQGARGPGRSGSLAPPSDSTLPDAGEPDRRRGHDGRGYRHPQAGA